MRARRGRRATTDNARRERTSRRRVRRVAAHKLRYADPSPRAARPSLSVIMDRKPYLLSLSVDRSERCGGEFGKAQLRSLDTGAPIAPGEYPAEALDGVLSREEFEEVKGELS